MRRVRVEIKPLLNNQIQDIIDTHVDYIACVRVCVCVLLCVFNSTHQKNDLDTLHRAEMPTIFVEIKAICVFPLLLIFFSFSFA